MELCQKGSLLAARKALNLLAIFGLLLTVPAIAGVDGAAASKAISQGELAKSLTDALEKANKYSMSTGGIGIIMSYGTKNGVSAEEIGDAFVNELRNRGYESRFYFYNTSRDGVALSFRIGYSSLGPWGPDEAAGNINQVTARADAARKVHEATKK